MPDAGGGRRSRDLALLLGLQPGERLAVRARGLGDGAGGAKLFEIKSQVER